MCFGNVSKDFTIDNMKKTGLKRSVNFFSVDYRSINTNEINISLISIDTNVYFSII